MDSWSASKVVCDLCGYSWIGVYPTDIEKLECANCGNMVYYEEISEEDDD